MLALGTAVGSILLYSTVKGELHSKLIVSMYIFYVKEIRQGNWYIRDLLNKTKTVQDML